MRILLTGGAGFIGSHVAEHLLAHDHEVAVVDDLSTGRRENVPDGARFYKLDIRSERDLPSGRPDRRKALGKGAELRCCGERAGHY